MKEMFYLSRKEGNVLFNNALNTFYLWLYGVRLVIKDHSDSERGNPLLPHGLLFPINSKGSFNASSHRQDNLCYTICGALPAMRNSSMGPPWGIDPMTHCTMSRCSTTEDVRKCFISWHIQHILFTVIWHHTYGKRPFI